MNALRIQIERETLEKRKLEDGVMEKLLYQLTMDKATQHTRKMVEKLRQRAKQMVCHITCVAQIILNYCVSPGDRFGHLRK